MPKPRREKEREQRRAHILEAAERVFGRRPFDQVSMAEIAAEAELGMQGIYGHFRSKSALYQAVILGRMRAFEADVEAAMRDGKGPRDRLLRMAATFARLFQRAPYFFPMFLREKNQTEWSEEPRFGAEVRDGFLREMARVRSISEEGVRTGDLRGEDPRFLAMLAMNVMLSSLQYHLQFRPDEAMEDVVARAERCLLDGVGRKG